MFAGWVSIFLATTSLASETTPASINSSERESAYEERGMGFAKKLYQGMDGSAEDESRSRKAETLNFKIRERGIGKLENYLARNKNLKVRQDLLHRLSQLYEQQAEGITRRSDVKNKEFMFQEALRQANRHLESIRKEFPGFAPDATLFSLAENYAKLKDDRKAETYYKEVINRYPRSSVVADSLLSLGNLYFEKKAFSLARSHYNRILGTPESTLHPYAHYKMAWCFFNENEFPMAVAQLEKSIYESRKLQQNGEKKLGVEEEALSDLVLFFAEYGNPSEAKGYFEKVVGTDKANELRYQLARRLFEHGKHLVARDVARQLLDEHPQKEFVNKLYLILISVAERTKDRDFGLKTAEKLATWIKDEKLESASAERVESEEYMRLYSQKLHHEAETLKQKEVWLQARKAYEIYLATFPNEAETPEVKFRYAVLLLNQKDQLQAYRSVTEAVAKMDAKHPRFKEALRIRVQSIELATTEERKKIDDKDFLAAYDAYAKNYPDEELGIEASYKAAELSKNLESPEQAAARFKSLAEAHPEHKLANASISEALAVLVKAQKWEALNAASKNITEKVEIQSSLLDKDGDIKKKVAEARELSQVKITEGLEADGRVDEAKAQYEKILAESPSESMGVYSYTRLAALSEQKRQKNREAIRYFEELRSRYPATAEARKASLELARLYEKVNEPREAVKRYVEFSQTGSGKIERQSLTNAAVILESLGEREEAAGVFFRLAETARGQKSLEKDGREAFVAGCNNMLLSSYQTKEKRVLQKIHDCARQLSSMGGEAVLWQARAAWALDQMAEGLQSDDRWKSLAGRSLKSAPETDRAYVAMAKLKILERTLQEFIGLKFQKTNERPEANISKKTKAMEEIERMAETVIKIGTPKQVLGAKNVIRLAYVDFAETMESAALPSKLNETEKEELKKSFMAFAKEFRDRAAGLENKSVERGLASVNPEPPAQELAFGGLSGDESTLLEEGQVPESRAAELFAKKAFALYQDGKFGEAKYFAEKWKKELGGGSGPYGSPQWEKFQSLLGEKIPDQDPVSKDF